MCVRDALGNIIMKYLNELIMVSSFNPTPKFS